MKNKETYNPGVGGDQEWHTGKQGDFFTLDGSENLGVTDMFVDDGFDIIHQHAGEVHLSDLSPEEEETAIPKGSKKVKKTLLKPRLDKEPFNVKLTEHAPKPGSSSAEGFDDKDLPYETEYLTLGEILSRVENIAYYREVLKDLQDDKEDWTVTQTVKRYADYWMENPESITGPDFPPIQVIGNGMKDGSHRISTLNALAKHIDSDNPYWEDVKLEVRFYDPETVMASGHYYPWLWDISDEDLQQAIDDKVYNWEVLERWLADPNAKSDLKKLRAESWTGTNEQWREEGEGPSFRDNPKINDDKLNIPKDKFLEYLNNYEREKLIKELTPTLRCIIYNCYDGWQNDPDNWWDEDDLSFDEQAQGYCNDCGEQLNEQLEQVDMQIMKLGLVSEPNAAYLQKPYPYTYNQWIEGIAQEINPKLFVNQDEEIDLITQHEVPQRIDEHIDTGISPHLEVKDIIRVLDVDGEHARMPDRWGLYKVVNVGSSYDEYYDIVPYPSPHPWNEHIKTLYRGDKWIYADVDRKTINEHKQPGISPELEVGEIIRIVDIDRERESGETIYTTPPEGYRPERWAPYEVVKKESAGHKAKWPFKYILVPEGEIWTTGRNEQGKETSNEKLLFPWVYQWIYADVPMVTNVDRKTISEQTQLRQTKNLNPDLMVGDEIIVVSTEGIHDFGAPNLFKPYVVVGIKHGTTMNREIHKWTHDEDEEQTPDRNRLGFRKGFDTIPYTYYQIEPIGMTDEERTGAMLAGGGRMKPMYIFPSPSEYRGSDQWILRPGFRRGELNEDDGAINDMVYIDEPREKHIKRMGKDLGVFDNFPVNNFMSIPPPENESDTTEDEIQQIEDIPVDNKFVDTTDDIHKHFKRFLKSKNLEYPEDEIEEMLSYIGPIVLKLKYHYNRPRPQQVAAAKELELNPTTLDSASTPSYPSGHATQGRFIGRYLTDIYPDYHDELLKVGDEVGDGRLMAKVHYPSDQAFGKVLGDELYNYYYSTKGLKLKEITLKEEMEELSPPLELRDKIMVWDLEPDPQPPGTYDQAVEKMPSTLIGTVIDILDDDEIDEDSYRGGIKYLVRDDNSGEEYGLYQGIFKRKYSQSKMVRDLSGRDKWKIIGRYEEIVNEQIDPDEFGIIDGEKKEKNTDEPQGDEHGKFTPKEIVIMNYIAKKYTLEELGKITTESLPWGDMKTKWDNVMKLFSIPTDSVEDFTYSSRYAMWAKDNWSEATDPYDESIDFGNVVNPLKTTLKWYDVDMDETGTQVEYKSGSAEVMGYDENDAKDRAMDDFYEWGGEMETHDWGDYESHDSTVERVEFNRIAEDKKDEIDEDLENWAYDDEEIGVVEEQMLPDKIDMIKHDIFKVLSSRFEVIKDIGGEISDNEGNKYSIIDTEEEVEDVTISDLLVPITDFLSVGIEDGIFTPKDVDRAISSVTDWLSLELNKKHPLLN